MNWLNRLDNALEDVLTPNPSRHGKPSDSNDRRHVQSLGADLQKALNEIHDGGSSSSSEGGLNQTPQRRRRTGSTGSAMPPPPASSPMLPGRLRRQMTPVPSTGGSVPGSVKRTPKKVDGTVIPLKRTEQELYAGATASRKKSGGGENVQLLDEGGLDASEKKISVNTRPPRPCPSKERLLQQEHQNDQLSPAAVENNANDDSTMEEIPLSSSPPLNADLLLGKAVPDQTMSNHTQDSPEYETPAKALTREARPAPSEDVEEEHAAASVVSELSTSLSTTTPSRVYPGSVKRNRPVKSSVTKEDGDTLKLPEIDNKPRNGTPEPLPSSKADNHDAPSPTVVSAKQLSSTEEQSSDRIETFVAATDGALPVAPADDTLPVPIEKLEGGLSSSDNVSFESAVSFQNGNEQSDDDSKARRRNMEVSDCPSKHEIQPTHAQKLEVSEKAKATEEVPIETVADSLKQTSPNDQSHQFNIDQDDSENKDGDNIDADEGRGDVPRQVLYRSEFDTGSLSGLWGPEDAIFDNNMNCRGTVHVRILRAQRLPCSVGSAVQAIVSLKPWKGRVHTPKTTAFFGPTDNNGVCVQWEEDETKPILMVHSYSDHESPVPRIRVDLRFVPLGMFGFTMCSLELDCEFLIMNPLQATRKWFLTDNVSQAEPEQGTRSRFNRTPLIEIEAMFEPDVEVLDAISRTSQSVLEPVDGIQNVEASVSVSGASLLGSGTAVKSRMSVVTPSRLSDELSLPTYSLGGSSQKKLNTKPHLLQLKTFRTPASCSVCKRSIMSSLWKKKAFRCETCRIDCCSDCRLQVDLQLPCGSEAAKQAVAEAIQHKFTVENLMSVVAPVSEEYSTLVASSSNGKDVVEGAEGGIGVLKVEFVRAYVLSEKEYFQPGSDPSEVFRRKEVVFHRGDYYMRLTRVGSTETVRTETIQNSGKPRFSSGELHLRVPHYGSDFRVELVDATTDKTIGSSFVLAQSLLQRQRDVLIEKEGISLFRCLQRPPVFNGLVNMELELRLNMSNASDFFSPHKSSSPVIGCAEILIGLEENLESLYGSNPYACPSRPPDGLDMSLFQIHLRRIGALIEDAKSVLRTYQYIVSWENPLVTGFAFLLFLQCCLRFDPTYLGSLPAFFIIVVMVVSAAKRFYGMQKKRFIEKEASSVRQAESVTVEYMLHRPIGQIGVSVQRARNLRSAELGLPGNAGCQVYWDSTRLMTEAEKEFWANVDTSAVAHKIGSTAYVYATNPQWDYMEKSEATKRMRSLLASDVDVFEAPLVDRQNELIFPVLQPYNVAQSDLYSLKPWRTSKGALVVEIKFSDVLNVVGSEYSLGDVCIPLSELCVKNEVSGWFHVSVDGYATYPKPTHEDDGTPQLYLNIRWLPPKVSEEPVSDSERELSIALQEELIRSAILSREQKGGSGLVGSSLGALQTVRGITGNLQMVQNYIGAAVDFVEASRNAFNFTDPWKSTIILVLIVIFWLFFTIVPLRTIILVVGLLQFGLTFFVRFGSFLSVRNNKAKEEDTVVENADVSMEKDAGTSDADVPGKQVGSSDYSPPVVWLMNAFHGLPTEEDLRKTYFWESRRFALHEAEAFVNEKRKKRLRNLWRAEWYSSVQMLGSEENSSDLSWTSRFAVIQGHRLLWWDSINAFDSGNAPTDRILLAGHAGLATPSPLELKKIDERELDRIVSIFGRGNKVTMLVSSVDVKIELERAVENALTSKRD